MTSSSGTGSENGSAEERSSTGPYDAASKVLVLSADVVGGFVAPGVLVNHITQTKIYGDGKVVFIDPGIGSGQIQEGLLSATQLSTLFLFLRDKGFWGFADSYTKQGPADMPTNVISAKLRGQPDKRVACYGGALSAPPGFMECYQHLSYPQLHPQNIQTYVREPIKQEELNAGWYYGFEYQKKLNTPADWVWHEAGRSSAWRRPEHVEPAVTLDSGYMVPTVDGCHHIQIRYSGSPTAPGSTIQFDRNGMSPDPYGDIGITTLIYFTPKVATFAAVQDDAKKHLFAVTVPGYLGPKLRLVVFGNLAHPDSGRLLVLDSHDAIANIYPLVRR
jgi:hypothetical protein